MKFYCKCGNELKTPGKRSSMSLCPWCSEEWIPLPDYETIAQYEKRTGGTVQGYYAVYARIRNISTEPDFWRACTYDDAKEMEAAGIVKAIVCAHPDGMPPEDWEPAEE